MSKLHKIVTPNGVLEQRRGKDGTVTARLTWNKGFGQQMSMVYDEAQTFVDSEVIRRMNPYVPMDSGFLKMSATLLTVLGSGQVVQMAPYARKWYYTPAKFSGAPKRGTYWFERMKNEGGKEAILRGAKLIVARRK